MVFAQMIVYCAAMNAGVQYVHTLHLGRLIHIGDIVLCVARDAGIHYIYILHLDNLWYSHRRLHCFLLCAVEQPPRVTLSLGKMRNPMFRQYTELIVAYLPQQSLADVFISCSLLPCSLIFIIFFHNTIFLCFVPFKTIVVYLNKI